MPLVKRTVEPIYIGRTPLDNTVKNELEGVVVNSLAGVIKQLSSISKHAENLFGDLINEANSIFQRSAALNQRVETLYQKTSRLDSAAKEEGLCPRGIQWEFHFPFTCAIFRDGKFMICVGHRMQYQTTRLYRP